MLSDSESGCSCRPWHWE